MNQKATFWEHFEALRHVLVRSGWALLGSTLLSFYFHQQILNFLLKPLPIETLYLFSPLDGFLTSLKLSFWFGVILATPIWLHALLNFILPALRLREKKHLPLFLILSFIAISGGFLFAHQITLPLVIQFFQKFNSQIGQNMWGMQQTLSLIITLLLSHCIVFELYLGLFYLIHFRWLTYQQLKKARRAVIVCTFVLSAILTPPDLLSQVLLALPMLLFFELATFYSKLIMGKFIQS
ncbi:MAG: Sec-independent protein translocase protein TatC [Chlamydiales bacterium]|nr:Sec-independent protein translocase protein TatC [Chlamydiales bacterium]